MPDDTPTPASARTDAERLRPFLLGIGDGSITPRLTAAQARVLAYLDTDEGMDDLVVSGREAYYGYTRTTVAVVNSLLRLCAISCVGSEADEMRYYRINGTGQRLLAAHTESRHAD